MLPGNFDQWLDREWLLTNGRGGFACSTLIGCPTRRQHGWMVWNLPGPRMARWMLWSHAAENLQVHGRTYLLANFEFNNAVDPHGYRHLTSVEVSLDPPAPSVTWRYQIDTVRVERRLSVVEGEDLVIVRYEVEGRPDADVRLQVWPMIACRPLGELRRKTAGGLVDMTAEGSALGFRYRLDPRIVFGIVGRRGDGGPAVEFMSRGDWWYNFRYRREAERGLDFGEDLMVPGAFAAAGRGRAELELVGVAGTSDLRQLWRVVRRIEGSVPAVAPAPTCRISVASGAEPQGELRCTASMEPLEVLQRAARQFLYRQIHPDGRGRIGLVAGYPWLEEYCRDACVSIPGLLLLPGRFDEARELLLQIALLRRDGALPSHLADEANEDEYVSADAALWFVYAVEAYLKASGDGGASAKELLKASLDIVRALWSDQRRGVRLDGDGLLVCEDVSRAATWMDARYAWVFTTPRTGKPVEVNALWYHALCVVGERLTELDPEAAEESTRLANRVRATFAAAFWDEASGGLYDVVTAEGPDASIRPNQIFAVSLEHSPLSDAQQLSVVRLVESRLLTPLGLRTLAPDAPEYCGRYEGDARSRERAAHEGSVYAWLMGPFVEAYLGVYGHTARAKSAAKAMLEPLMAHVTGAGCVAGVSELFDGDPPHAPRGCIHQAWSVAEVLRAWALATGAAAPATRGGEARARRSGARARSSGTVAADGS